MQPLASSPSPSAVLASLDSSLPASPLLQLLESKLGIPRLALALAILLLASLVIFHGVGLRLITVLLGFLYPLCASLRALAHGDESTTRSWTVYWLVFVLINASESLMDASLWWLPLYQPLKLAFLLWCYLPSTQGSLVVYECVLEPLLQRHSHAIDQSLDSISEAATVTAHHVINKTRKASVQLLRSGPILNGSVQPSALHRASEEDR